LRDLDLIAVYEAPGIATALARADAARAAIRTATAIPNPTLTFNPASVTGGGDAPPFFLAATLIQLIETAGKRPLRIAKARYLAESARFQAAAEAWRTVARVDTAAIDFAAARTKMVALDEQASIQRDLLDTAAKRRAVGLGSSVEMNLARTALTRFALDREATRAAEVEAIHRLAEAIGLDEAALPMDRLAMDLQRPPLPEAFLRSASDSAAVRRADVLESVADYAASVVEVGVQRAGRVPNVELGPSVEYDQGTKKWGASVGVALPIFNRNGGPIDEAEARRHIAQGQLSEVQASAIGEIDRTIAAYRQAAIALSVADRLIAGLSRQLAAQRKLVGAGQSGLADVLNAKADVALARVGRADALATLARARLAVEVAAQVTSDGFDPIQLLPALDTR